MSYFKKHWQTILLCAIIIVSACLMIFSAKSDSLTNDEKIHIPAGYLHVWRGNYRFNTEHPPLLNDLAGLFAKIAQPNLPEKIQVSNFNDVFFYESNNNVDKIVFWARLPSILLTLGLIYLVFLWARTLFGPRAGLLAAVLVAFSPNILAHGRLATTDIGLVFFFVLTCWLLRKHIFKPSWQNAILLGLSLGLTLLTKFSSPIIIPIILLGLIYLWISQKPKIIIAAGQFLIIFVIALIVIWGIYAFSMRSDMTTLIGPFEKYFQGFNTILQYNDSGWLAYLNGKTANSFWYYFPLVLLYKMPLTEIILLTLSIISLSLRGRHGGRSNLHQIDCFVADAPRKDNYIGGFDYYLLIFPPLLFLGVSMISGINIGIRHILVILPFFFIFTSRLMNIRYPIVSKVVLILLGAHIIISILAFPNYLGYFNQIAGGSKNGIKYLADSNLDWNQNIKRLAAYVHQNNIQKVYGVCWDSASLKYYGIDYESLPKSPVNGVVIICTQQLIIPPPKIDYSWVTNYTADDMISNGIYVWRFDLRPTDIREQPTFIKYQGIN